MKSQGECHYEEKEDSEEVEEGLQYLPNHENKYPDPRKAAHEEQQIDPGKENCEGAHLVECAMLETNKGVIRLYKTLLVCICNALYV